MMADNTITTYRPLIERTKGKWNLQEHFLHGKPHPYICISYDDIPNRDPETFRDGLKTAGFTPTLNMLPHNFSISLEGHNGDNEIAVAFARFFPDVVGPRIVKTFRHSESRMYIMATRKKWHCVVQQGKKIFYIKAEDIPGGNTGNLAYELEHMNLHQGTGKNQIWLHPELGFDKTVNPNAPGHVVILKEEDMTLFERESRNNNLELLFLNEPPTAGLLVGGALEITASYWKHHSYKASTPKNEPVTHNFATILVSDIMKEGLQATDVIETLKLKGASTKTITPNPHLFSDDPEYEIQQHVTVSGVHLRAEGDDAGKIKALLANYAPAPTPPLF